MKIICLPKSPPNSPTYHPNLTNNSEPDLISHLKNHSIFPPPEKNLPLLWIITILVWWCVWWWFLIMLKIFGVTVGVTSDCHWTLYGQVLSGSWLACMAGVFSPTSCMASAIVGPADWVHMHGCWTDTKPLFKYAACLKLCCFLRHLCRRSIWPFLNVAGRDRPCPQDVTATLLVWFRIQ